MNHHSRHQDKKHTLAQLPDAAGQPYQQGHTHLNSTCLTNPYDDPELEYLNQIIDTALSLDPARQKDFIHQACGSNKAFKERVLSLINCCTTPPPPEFLQPPSAVREVAQFMYMRYVDGG